MFRVRCVLLQMNLKSLVFISSFLADRFYMAKSKPVTSIAHFDITNYLNATDESVLVQLEYITSGLLPPIRRIEADADTPTIFVASNALGNKYTYDPNGLVRTMPLLVRDRYADANPTHNSHLEATQRPLFSLIICHLRW